MKINTWIPCFLLFLTIPLYAQVPVGTAAGSRARAIVERGPHHKIWQVARLDQQGTTNVSTYTELATGISYVNLDTGQWEDSEERFEIAASGHAIARRGQHKVILAPNINSAGAVDVQTGDGNRFVSNPMGLTFYDKATGASVLFAEVKDCIGEFLPPNVIIYRDAFNGLKAALRYTYTKAGFEQDVILYENPGSPAAYGMAPETSFLELFTEFIEAPLPLKTSQRITAQLNDENLDFGRMSIRQGKAFDLNNGENAIPVGKAWQRIDGRDFLIESVEFGSVEGFLGKLQARAQGTSKTAQMAQQTVPNRGALLGLASMRSKSQENRETRLASIKVGQSQRVQGFVLDYTLDTDQTDFVFRGDTTYYVSGPVNLNGMNNVVEGGAILKYAVGAKIRVLGTAALICKTASYRPAILTAKDDDTIGDWIDGSTGMPSGYYATSALQISTPASSLKHIRISHAQEALRYDYSSSWTAHDLRHAQITQCDKAVYALGYHGVYFGNVLARNVTTLFDGDADDIEAIAENITVDNCNLLLNGAPRGGTLTARNSLFANVTTLKFGALTSVNGSYNGFFVAPVFGAPAVSTLVNPFQNVAGGDCYLATSFPFRDAGTESIDGGLLTDLAKKTTYAPIVLGLNISSDTILDRRALRDTDIVDCGYHYDPLDYLAVGVTVAPGVTVLATNGVAIGIDYSQSSWGFILDSARFIAQGSPQELTRIVRAHVVQERSSGNPGERAVFYDNALAYWEPPRLCEARFRFTEFSQLPNDGYFLYTGMAFAHLEWSHSRFINAGLVVECGGFEVINCGLTNTLWEWGATVFYGQFGPGAVHLRNNLYRNHYFHFTDATALWTVKDNLFDQSTMDSHGSTPDNSYNAHYLCQNSMLSASGNTTLGALNFQPGSLGAYYLPSSATALINAGSRLARDAGLFHYTTQVTQTKEASTTVDIGLHYVTTGCGVADTVWVDDSLPAGAQPASLISDEGWTWITSNPLPFSGQKSHYSATPPGAYDHQHGFTGATSPLVVNPGDTLITYVYIDPSVNPIREIMLQWWDGIGWEHRAYWGADVLPYGVSGTPSRRHMGPLPPAGQWVRLEVPANKVGLENTLVTGMAFSMREGSAAWDYVGKSTGAFICDSDGDGLSDYVEDANGNGLPDAGESSFSIADTDDDGLSDLEEFAFGLDPTSNQNPNATVQRNYTYDLLDRLINVTGKGAVTIVPDKEGNIEQVTP